MHTNRLDSTLAARLRPDQGVCWSEIAPVKDLTLIIIFCRNRSRRDGKSQPVPSRPPSALRFRNRWLQGLGP